MKTPESLQWQSVDVKNLEAVAGFDIVDIPHRSMEDAFASIEEFIPPLMGSDVKIQGKRATFFNTLGRFYTSNVAGVAPHFMAVSLCPEDIGQAQTILTTRLYAPYNSPKAAEYIVGYTAKEGRIGRNSTGLVVCREVLDKCTIPNTYEVSALARHDTAPSYTPFGGGRRSFPVPNA